MNRQHLELLLWLVKDPHLSRTALRLRTTQSHLSKSLAAMENEWGVVLFERQAGRSLVPTPAAHRLARDAERLLALWDDSVRLCRDADNGRPDFVLSGPPLFLRTRFLPRWYAEGLERQARLVFVGSRFSEAGKTGSALAADAMILKDPAEAPEYRSRVIYEERMCYLCHRSAVPESRGSPDWDDSRWTWAGYRPAKDPLSRLAEAGVIRTRRFEVYVEDTQSLLDLIRLKPTTVTVLPAHSLGQFDQDIVAFPIPNASPFPLHYMYRHDSPLTETIHKKEVGS